MLESAEIRRVLVVDDERCIADTLAAILRNFGYDAIARYDGSTALQECERHVPDLVISDVVMPGLDGIDMAIEIKNRHPGCKIFLFSGLTANSDLLLDPRLEEHQFEVLSKPIHPEELLARVSSRRFPEADAEGTAERAWKHRERQAPRRQAS